MGENDFIYYLNPQLSRSVVPFREPLVTNNPEWLNSMRGPIYRTNPYINGVADINQPLYTQSLPSIAQNTVNNTPPLEAKTPEKQPTGPSKFAQGMGMVAAMVPQNEMTIGGKTYKNGMWDYADPIAHIADGRETTIGNTGNKIGIGLFQAGAMSGNPYLMAAGAGLKVLSGGINAMWGIKGNKDNIATIKRDTDNKIAVGDALMSAKDVGSLASAAVGMSAAPNFRHSDLYRGGIFSKGKARTKGNKLIFANKEANDYQIQGLSTAMNNIKKNRSDALDAQATFAWGGPLGITGFEGQDNTGAIQYDFMSDLLNSKKEQSRVKDKISGITPMPTVNTFNYGGTMFAQGGQMQQQPVEEDNYSDYLNRSMTRSNRSNGPTEEDYAIANVYFDSNKKPYIKGKNNSKKYISQKEADQRLAYAIQQYQKQQQGIQGQQGAMYALGGDVQTHGSDFTTGLSLVNSGGTHESNPNGGIKYGEDREGIPNLLEEGETVFNDYVFSKRIYADGGALKKFKMSKKKKITYADMSKALEKEIKERPNDPLSQASFNIQMEELAQEQERQKQEMEAAKAQLAFESMSPQEQIATMQQAEAQQQAAQEQQMMQEQAMQEQAAQEQMMAQSPQDVLAEQYAQQAAPEATMAAYGGKVNVFDDAGQAETKKSVKTLTPEERMALVFNFLGLNTEDEYNEFLRNIKFKHADRGNIQDPIQYLSIGSDFWNKEDFYQDATFKELLGTSEDPIIKHLIENGYNLGVPKYTSNGVGINLNQDYGNWVNWQSWLDPKNPDAAAQELFKREGFDPNETISKGRGALDELISGTEAYKKGTEMLKNDPNLRLQYFLAVIDDPQSPKKAKDFALRFVDSKTRDWKKDSNGAYIDNSYDKTIGIERSRKAGTYWHTPMSWMRDKQVMNWLVNPDGTITRAVNVPDTWVKKGGPKSWSDDKGDWEYQYWENPEKKAEEAAEEEAAAEEKQPEYKPIKRWEDLRYAGILGPAIALGLQSAGVGKPNTALLDGALKSIQGGNAQADYKPIGNYLTYRPMDEEWVNNRNAATAQATNRAAMNIGLGTAGGIAGTMLANAYNQMQGEGQTHRQGLEYNLTNNRNVADYNKDTDKFNAEAYNRMALANAEMLNKHKELTANAAINAAAQKIANDLAWNQSIYGNIGSLTRAIADVGKENYSMNRIADMAAASIFGQLTPEHPLGSQVLKYADDKPKKGSAAYGGKLKRRKKGGLTV